MAIKWRGTVNLPASIAAPCNDPCHHGPARADSRWIGWFGTRARGAHEGLGLGKNGSRGVGETVLYAVMQ